MKNTDENKYSRQALYGEVIISMFAQVTFLEGD
jgi:hypothetical protein